MSLEARVTDLESRLARACASLTALAIVRSSSAIRNAATSSGEPVSARA